jgi:hypothetical protein
MQCADIKGIRASCDYPARSVEIYRARINVCAMWGAVSGARATPACNCKFLAQCAMNGKRCVSQDDRSAQGRNRGPREETASSGAEAAPILQQSPTEEGWPLEYRQQRSLLRAAAIPTDAAANGPLPGRPVRKISILAQTGRTFGISRSSCVILIGPSFARSSRGGRCASGWASARLAFPATGWKQRGLRGRRARRVARSHLRPRARVGAGGPGSGRTLLCREAGCVWTPPPPLCAAVVGQPGRRLTRGFRRD